MRQGHDDYYGSEQHFRDIQDAARRSGGYIEDPKTLSECGDNFRFGFRQLLTALGFFRLCDKIILSIGKLLLTLGFKNEN